MLNTILFTIIFVWLIVLSVQQAKVKNWFDIMQKERNRVLEFIEMAKANWKSKDESNN